MTTDYKAITKRFLEEVWNKGHLDVTGEVLAENFTYHDFLMPEIHSAAGYQKYAAEVRASYPDFHMTIEELIQEGDTVAFKGYWEGTQLGTSPGLKVPASGKKVRVKYSAFAYGADGKLVEARMYQDWVGIMRQLGLLPQPSAA